jgi:hypothetical protein
MLVDSLEIADMKHEAFTVATLAREKTGKPVGSAQIGIVESS